MSIILRMQKKTLNCVETTATNEMKVIVIRAAVIRVVVIRAACCTKLAGYRYRVAKLMLVCL